jgi:hypothetical protein
MNMSVGGTPDWEVYDSIVETPEDALQCESNGKLLGVAELEKRISELESSVGQWTSDDVTCIDNMSRALKEVVRSGLVNTNQIREIQETLTTIHGRLGNLRRSDPTRDGAPKMEGLDGLMSLVRRVGEMEGHDDRLSNLERKVNLLMNAKATESVELFYKSEDKP